MSPFFVHAESSGSASHSVIGEPERQLHEILTFSYEAALEAGLAPKRAFAVIEDWLASEQLSLEEAATAAKRVLSSAV
jgi:hypothetical protein